MKLNQSIPVYLNNLKMGIRFDHDDIVTKLINRRLTMDSVFKYLNGFLGGLFALLTALLPVTILFQVLTGTGVFGLDVISNLTSIIQTVGESGFAGLVAILFVCSFFIKK